MKFIKNKINNKFKTGFTLIETLVAISILLLSIIGPMEIAARGLSSAYYARDEITAYYLAQEGVEYVRNLRDEQYLVDFEAGTVFSNSLGGEWIKDPAISECIVPEGNPNKACYIDIFTGVALPCSKEGTDSCKRPERALKYNKITNEYSYSAVTPDNQPSKFYRIITIKLDSNQQADQEAIVTSKVVWSAVSLFAGTERSFTITERLINWQR